jgi:hypothetical protein
MLDVAQNCRYMGRYNAGLPDGEFLYPNFEHFERSWIVNSKVVGIGFDQF